MNERAELQDPAQAAQQAVKAYIRMHREKLAEDGELLSLLLPQRFGDGKVRDLVQIVGGSGSDNVPDWAPDGGQFAFVSYQWLPEGDPVGR